MVLICRTGQAKQGGDMTYSKIQTFSRWCPLLAVVMLMFSRASTVAAGPQASSGAQAPSAVEPASDSVVPRLIQFSGIVKDAEGPARLSGTLHGLAGRRLARRTASRRLHHGSGPLARGSAGSATSRRAAEGAAGRRSLRV